MDKMHILQIFSVMIILMLFATLGLYAVKFKKYEKYIDVESSIVADIKKQNIKSKNDIKMFASIVVPTEEYKIDEFKVENDICNGYVKIRKYIFTYSYKAYIKCNNYKTSGFNK